ncbi:hypothetical protein [Burkholderia vietnamiensis]|uniref:hypothetical protein n=1 Tax=Burkholderia vietnamiensis TaxID=60552 RepID=UPI0015949DCD|nr:hypothetical protein [Burkholderia vietnamiensis]
MDLLAYFKRHEEIKYTIFSEIAGFFKIELCVGKSEEYLMDDFNNYYNEIEYYHLADDEFLDEFYKLNQGKIQEFSRNWYDFNQVPEDRKKITLLDYYMNEMAWSNYNNILQMAKEVV